MEYPSSFWKPVLGMFVHLALFTLVASQGTDSILLELESSCNFTERSDVSFLGPLHRTQVGNVSFGYYSFGPLQTSSANGSNGSLMDQPTLMLLTGFSATTSSWTPALLQGIAQNRALIVADNPGIGFSTDGNSSMPLTISGQASAYAGLVTALGLACNDSSNVNCSLKPNVMGWSMGGSIALQLAVSYGHLFERFIIVSGVAQVSNATASNLAQLASVAENTTGIELLLGLRQELFPNTTAGLEATCGYIQGTLSMPLDSASSASISRQMEGQLEWPGVETSLVDIQNPVLLVQGGADVIANPSGVTVLVGNIPNSSLIRFPAAGHGVLFQDTPANLVYINEFLVQQM